MKKTLLYSVLSLSLIFPTISNAQCGFDVIRNKQLQNPAFEIQEQANEVRIKNFVNNVSLTSKAGTVYTIPVVVHVLHKGEAVGSGTNISDAQIQSGIDRLNEVYRGLDPNSPIDFEIEFTLAQRDPNCNATTGINRVNATSVPNYSANGVFLQSVGADENTLKDLSRWPETDYLNIWIVTEIDNNNGGSGIQGYANFFNGNAYEGSVMMYTVFGYDPTNANPSWPLSFSRDNSTPIHEFGHYFHLYHTFQGDNDDVDCPGDAVVGTDSDGCADTEIHKRHTSTCPTNNDCLGNNPYGLNTRNNYMSYFSCTDRLTNNQKTRVTAAMSGTSIVASKGGIAPDPSYAAPVAVCNTNTVTTNNAGITSVELNGTTFTSFSSSSDGGNIDKSANCSGYFEIDASVSNTINVGMYTVNFQQLGVWIDWNDDGDFNDDSEQQHLSEDIAASSTVPIIINYPTSIPYDDYVRIRLITDLDNRYGPGTINSSCYGSIVYGQSEDYAIYVQPAAGVAPVADFSGTPTTLCAGNTVVFTDLSTNTPTSWSWTFTGGTPSSSSAQNPTITYNTAGTYQVQLTATNASGNDVETKIGYITVNPLPGNAGAITGSTSECENATGVAYSISSVSGATGYNWTVPSGATVASGQNTTSITVDFGVTSGNVSVTPTNSCGNGGQANKAVTIAPCGSAPVANFSTNTTTICAGESVNFTDLSTNTPTSWSWDFGDGGMSSSQNTTYTYNTAGTYTVTLTAINANGSDDEVKTNLITVNALPTINTSSTNETCTKNDGTATASGGGTYLWDDALSQVTSTAIGLVAGTYNITITSNGCSAQQSVIVNADNCVPNTQIRTEFCGIVLGNIIDEVRAYSVAGANQYEYRLTEQGTGTILTYSYGIYKLKLAWFVGIKYNTTYSVDVRARIGSEWGVFSNACNITTPVMPSPNVTSPVCGTTISSLTDLIYVQPVNKATNYEYRLTEQGTANIYYWNNTIYRVCLSWFGSAIKYNTVYELQTRAYVNGDWSDYSPICEVTTPNIPTPNVLSGQCGTIISSLNELIYFTGVNKATNYEYRLTEQGTANIYFRNNTIYRVCLSWFGISNIKPNTVYELQARAYVNGAWGNFGNICEITSPSSAMVLNETARLMPDNDNETKDGLIFPSTTLSIYPNPNSGEQLNVNLENLIPNSTLTISDIYGKIILTKPLNTDQSEYKINVKFENKLTSGFYLVTIISEGNRIVEKLIVR